MSSDKLSEEEKKKLKELLAKAQPEELKVLMEEDMIPRFEWNSNLTAFKILIRKVLKEPGIKDEKLVEYLKGRNKLTSKAKVDNYGYVFEETGLFRTTNGKVYLTEIGRKIAKEFNDDEDFTTFEIVVMRGLQVQGAGFTVLNIINMTRGILREDLMAKMEDLYGGKGRYFTGYFVRVFKQLKLIEKTTENGKAKYIPKFPVAWSNIGVPSASEESED
jgi:hypothetical protein